MPGQKTKSTAKKTVAKKSTSSTKPRKKATAKKAALDKKTKTTSDALAAVLAIAAEEPFKKRKRSLLQRWFGLN